MFPKEKGYKTKTNNIIIRESWINVDEQICDIPIFIIDHDLHIDGVKKAGVTATNLSSDPCFNGGGVGTIITCDKGGYTEGGDTDKNIEEASVIAAHEIGHYLTLNHLENCPNEREDMPNDFPINDTTNWGHRLMKTKQDAGTRRITDEEAKHAREHAKTLE